MCILWFAPYFTLMRSLFCVLALFYLIESEAALEEEAEAFVFGVGFAGGDECAEVVEIDGAVDVF